VGLAFTTFLTTNTFFFWKSIGDQRAQFISYQKTIGDNFEKLHDLIQMTSFRIKESLERNQKQGIKSILNEDIPLELSSGQSYTIQQLYLIHGLQ